MENGELKEIDILREPMAIGDVFAKSGMFPDIKTQAQAVVKIMAGKELGLSPFQAVSGIYMVNGKLALQSNVMASLIKNSKKYDYSVEVLTNEECSIVFYQKIQGKDDTPLGTSSFTIKDAAKAGLVNKDVWKSYTKNLLFARSLSNGARWFCPDIICGWTTTEEMQDIEQGPIVADKRIIEMTEEGEVRDGAIETSV